MFRIHPSGYNNKKAMRANGFSLVELMIAITVGLLLISSLITIFISSYKTRNDADQGIEQIENGRYALQVLRSDIQISGFLDAFDIQNAGLATPTSKPNPCETTMAGLRPALPMFIQGYDNGATLTCLSDVKENTDIIVVRYASTCISGGVNCDYIAGAPYFQASLCNSSAELASSSSSDYYSMDTNVSNLNKHKRDCTTLADMRQYIVRIYFIANNDRSGDGIPTLKRAELGASGFSITSISSGIENMHFEYGIDTNGDGIPNVFAANPDIYGGCTGVSCNTNWLNVMTVKIKILAKNTMPSTGYTDTKIYDLGLTSSGSNNTFGPFNDAYKRHVYGTDVRVNNPAGRRQL